MNSAVVDALEADDKQRSDFLKACLLKLGMQVSPQEQTLPSLSPIHFSSIVPNGVENVLSAMEKDKSISTEEGREQIQGGVDTFVLERSSDTWSMGNVTRAISDTLKSTATSTGDDSSSADEPDKIIDYDQIVKTLKVHEGDPPATHEVPYFNHDDFYAALEAYINSDRRTQNAGLHIGKYLIYGEVVTSTSTLLEKYVLLPPSPPALFLTTLSSHRMPSPNHHHHPLTHPSFPETQP